MSIPLGKEESIHLELLGRQALEKPGLIARHVVAMLNSGGGEIWIGLSTDDPRTLERAGVPQAEEEARTLSEYLMDSIAPAPSPQEVRVTVEALEDARVLRVTLQSPGGRRPYAYLESGGWHFLIRQGTGIRPMHRNEIFGETGEASREVQATVRALLAEEREVQKEVQRNGGDLWWLRLQPSRKLSLDLREIENSELLVDPAVSGNRRAGFVAFASLAGFGPRAGQDASGRACLEVGRSGNAFLKIFEDGGLAFSAPLIDFWWPSRRPEESKTQLWPDAVLEYPISVFRIASQAYRWSSSWTEPAVDETDLVVHMAAFNLRGWSLRPGSPRAWSFRPPEARVFEWSDDFVLERPLVFPLRDMERPDACGFRLLQRFYEAFGFSRDQIPAELDRKAGRLLLPE